MLNFDTYVARFGESGVQALIERLERYEGIRSSSNLPLEDRWYVLMDNAASAEPTALAA